MLYRAWGRYCKCKGAPRCKSTCSPHNSDDDDFSSCQTWCKVESYHCPYCKVRARGHVHACAACKTHAASAFTLTHLHSSLTHCPHPNPFGNASPSGRPDSLFRSARAATSAASAACRGALPSPTAAQRRARAARSARDTCTTSAASRGALRPIAAQTRVRGATCATHWGIRWHAPRGRRMTWPLRSVRGA